MFRTLRSSVDLLAALLVIAVASALLFRLLSPTPRDRVERVGALNQGARQEPPLPTQPVSLSGAASIGSEDAPVAIITFSDFQCPYCRVFALDHWPQVKRELVDSGRARFAFRHLPLDSLHPQARRIATSAECARRQDLFWPFHDLLFDNQAALATADLGSMASSIGINEPSFTSCLNTPEAAAIVAADSSGASALAITGTPTFLVGRIESDGRVRVVRRLVGARDVDAFKLAVDESMR